jgi:hypothetical protein
MYHELGIHCTMCYVHFQSNALGPKKRITNRVRLENQTIRTFSSKETRAGTYEPGTNSSMYKSNANPTILFLHPHTSLTYIPHLTYQPKPKDSPSTHTPPASLRTLHTYIPNLKPQLQP